MNSKKHVTIKEFNDFFQFKHLTGDERSLEREIVVADTNRPGLELAGFKEKSDFNRVTLLGQKEMAYIRMLSDDMLQERFDFITNDIVPCIIITHNETLHPILEKIANRKNFPIFSSDLPTNRVMVNVVSFLDDKLASFSNIHGGLMSIFGKGVLITGESGIGKSELALDLINRGHVLVADDRVDAYRMHNRIIGKAPRLLRGYLEIRGIGIIDVVKMFGARAILDDIQIEFMIHLEHFDSLVTYERIGNEETYENIINVKIPKLTLPVKEGRNMSVLVESAVTNFTLKQMGINSSQDFEQMVYDHIVEENKRNGIK
ncbi:MAG: HPr(Ser) kinase/phosphatase [Erysipelotrichaceae bacterium]|nr:HPr(Ser) kinase/phosphatase [Erysipelotrichaceae bacterium]MDD3923787.1 HPr(Ser) kinase/phosphatase [Erysipelotrichaceae bacterium]